MNIAIIAYNKDIAGMNIRDNLIKEGIEKYTNVNLHTIEEEHIFADNLDKRIDADIFLFISKHRSEANKKTLCVHSVGNFGEDNSFGGKKRELVLSQPYLVKELFLQMRKLKPLYPELEEFDVTVEQSHHGPFLEKPTVFIEIGATEEEWSNKKAGEIIAKAIINVLSKPLKEIKKEETACVMGGGHYNQITNKILETTPLYIGHICSKYSLKYLNEEMIRQMLEKSNASFFIFDWKSCGKEKKRISEILNKLNIKYKKSKEL